MIYLHKILPYLIYPSTIILAFLIVGVLFKKRFFLILATTLFVITTNPIAANQILSYLEAGQLKKSVIDMQDTDAIVVLSGMLTEIETRQGVAFEWGDPDRFFGGIELVHSNKANMLIFTGGKLPWQKSNETEGDVLAQYAKKFGIHADVIQITKEVQNTEDEAKAVKELLSSQNLNKIILVTSAFHMPRAKDLFVKQGLEVQTYPVDFKVGASNITFVDFLPSAFAMKDFEFAIRELLGRAYYQLKDQ
jgi:uncharacterized SAM-binding protein YcdF (DUF218 family)